MSIRTRYTVSVNENSYTGQYLSPNFETEAGAIAECKRVALDTDAMVAVYAERTYSDDDTTPLAARSYFWCAYALRYAGWECAPDGNTDQWERVS